MKAKIIVYVKNGEVIEIVSNTDEVLIKIVDYDNEETSTEDSMLYLAPDLVVSDIDSYHNS